MRRALVDERCDDSTQSDDGLCMGNEPPLFSLLPFFSPFLTSRSLPALNCPIWPLLPAFCRCLTQFSRFSVQIRFSVWMVLITKQKFRNISWFLNYMEDRCMSTIITVDSLNLFVPSSRTFGACSMVLVMKLKFHGSPNSSKSDPFPLQFGSWKTEFPAPPWNVGYL